MADNTLKKLEDQLNCSICFDTFTDPKLLRCSHIFCQKCLMRLVSRDQLIVCPTCHQATPVSPNGVSQLSAALHITQLLDIIDDHKKARAYACQDHADKKIDLYCETCEQLICWRCIMKDGKHHFHDCYGLEVAVKRLKLLIIASLDDTNHWSNLL